VVNKSRRICHFVRDEVVWIRVLVVVLGGKSLRLILSDYGRSDLGATSPEKSSPTIAGVSQLRSLRAATSTRSPVQAGPE